jgi:DNA-binding MarR family transcriptional regulator
MGLDNSISYLLAKIAGASRDRLDKSLSEIGLYGGQSFVLISLWESDGLNQTELSQKLNVSPPTISAMVKSLSKNNFIKILKCERDGRATRIYLTEKGVGCQNFVETKWIEAESAAFSSLTETEKLIFRQILEKLKENSPKKT